MQEALHHFRNLSMTLEAARVAFNAQSADLQERINSTAAAVARIEDSGQDASHGREELRRLKRERANLKAPSFHDPLSDVERFAKTHSRLVLAEQPVIKLPQGQTWLAVHNNQSEKTDKVLAEISRVLAAPADAASMRSAIVAQLDAIATPPRLVNGALVFPKHVVDSNGMAITVVNIEGVLALLCGDAIVAALAKGDGDGMSADERAAAMSDLQVKLVKAFRAENVAAMNCERQGQRVIRRRHVHPGILLGVHISPAAVFDWYSKKRGV